MNPGVHPGSIDHEIWLKSNLNEDFEFKVAVFKENSVFLHVDESVIIW